MSGEDEVEKVKLKEYWLDEEKDYEKYGKEEKDVMEKEQKDRSKSRPSLEPNVIYKDSPSDKIK